MSDRASRYRKLCEVHGIEPETALAGITASPEIERYGAVGVLYSGSGRGYGISTWPTEQEAMEALGSAVLDGYMPDAVYDLDTGQRIEIHIANPVVTRSEDQGTMANPLAEEDRSEADELASSYTEPRLGSGAMSQSRATTVRTARNGYPSSTHTARAAVSTPRHSSRSNRVERKQPDGHPRRRTVTCYRALQRAGSG